MIDKDLKSYIHMRRLTELLIKIVLKPHQKESIHFFKKFVMQDEVTANIYRDPFAPKKSLVTAEEIWDDLDLNRSETDRWILWAILNN